MTRGYFLDNLTDWFELIELCRNYESNVCEDIIDDDTLDEYIDSDIEDATRYGRSWRDIRDSLNGIDTGYSCYRVYGAFDYMGMNDDEDFVEYKDRMLEWMDDGGCWDDGEEDEDGDDCDPEDDVSPDEEDEPPEPAVEDEDFSVSELMSMCGVELVTIQKVAEKRRREEDEDMLRLLAV